jgi:hypothetical protein
MRILRSLSVLAAWGFVGAAYAQTATAPGGPSMPTPSVTDSPTNPELAGASTAARQDGPRIAAASPGNITAGMQVRSESGDLLGNVASIVPGESNREGYVVIGNPSGVATPLPYNTARAMVRNETVVVNKERFQKAPKVQQYQGEDVSRAAWEEKADSYWKRYAMSAEQPNGVRR